MSDTAVISANGLLEALLEWMRARGSVLVAYSGGVDSALLMAAAHRALGERSLACIGLSPSYPEREMKEAIGLAERVGARFRTINTDELLDPNYAANPENRCYFCKSELFTRFAKIAKDEGYAVVVDGTNASDLGDVRYGRVAAAENAVRSPLLELGITKDQVRSLARQLDLPVWDKPAMACLASRVPHGTPIVPGLLKQVEQAEDVLQSLGFKQFRVRHHKDIARIELPAEDLVRAIEQREAIVAGVKAAGYRHVTLDLAGFRSGKEDPTTKARRREEDH